MSDETLPQIREQSPEFLGVSQIASQQHDVVVESDEAKSDQNIENQTDLVNVVSKDNKDGRGLNFRISKYLARNRSGKQSEEISIGSSKTGDTKSSVSNESRIDYSSKQVVGSSSSKLLRIGSQLKRLMKLKSKREIKTEEEVIIVPPPSPPPHENSISVSTIPDQIIEQEKLITENSISDTTLVALENTATTPDITNEEESVVISVQNDTENSDGGAIIIAENPPAILVAAALTAQLGAQAEAQIQTSRRNPRDAPRTTPFLYLQEDEPRVRNYVQNMLGGERDSIATGSESSSLSEVADANEQPEGHDAAEQYYNAILRAVIRKQFRHLDDEPPIY